MWHHSHDIDALIMEFIYDKRYNNARIGCIMYEILSPYIALVI